jgi:undecaprenyl-diphosphatase
MLKALVAIDSTSLLWFNRLQCYRSLTRFFHTVSRSGDGQLYVILTVLALVISGPSQVLFVKAALLAFLFEIPTFVCLKKLLKRNRPFTVLTFCQSALKPSDEFSMPSGHTAAAFLMAGVIAFCFPSLSLVAYIWATLIGLSRVFLGVHYPTDIVAGAVLGYTCAAISLSMLV